MPRFLAVQLCLLALLASPLFAQGAESPDSDRQGSSSANESANETEDNAENNADDADERPGYGRRGFQRRGFAQGPGERPNRAPEDDEEAARLREWFEALPAERQMQLRARARAVQRLPRERQREILESESPALEEPEVQNLERMRGIRYLHRVRLNSLRHELSMLRRFDNQGFQEAMELEGEERARALHRLLQRQRAAHFQRALTPEQRDELEALDDAQRVERLREMFREARTERRQKLIEAFPELKELREAAREGDDDAAEELRERLSDVLGLDFLTFRLSEEARDRVFEAARDEGMDAAVQLAREELRQQWQQEMRRMRQNREHNRERNRRPPPREERQGQRAPNHNE
jgi:hypothetical protein